LILKTKAFLLLKATKCSLEKLRTPQQHSCLLFKN
jgi:hypothetical protein